MKTMLITSMQVLVKAILTVVQTCPGVRILRILLIISLRLGMYICHLEPAGPPMTALATSGISYSTVRTPSRRPSKNIFSFPTPRLVFCPATPVLLIIHFPTENEHASFILPLVVCRGVPDANSFIKRNENKTGFLSTGGSEIQPFWP